MLDSDLVPDWEIVPVGDRVAETRVGVAAEQTLRLICRRRDDIGLTLPVAVEAHGPLAAEFVGRSEETTGPGGLITASHLVHVIHSASTRPGSTSGLLTFRWADPEVPSRDLELRWRVTPLLSVAPESLIVREDPGPLIRSVIVRSLDRPFRVLEVSGPLAAAVDPSPYARPVQSLRLALDPARLSADGAADVLIRTDHPDQPEATLTVLLLTPTQGAER